MNKNFSVPALWLLFATSMLNAQVQVAGTLYVDLRATHASAGSATWINQGTLGDFDEVGGATLSTNVLSTGAPGVFFGGADAYQGPNTPPDLDGADDRTIEVWAYNPALAAEETMVSWGHRGTDGRNVGFNFGNNAVWGALTHYGGAYDVGWGTPPSAGAWHHLVYTYSNQVTRVYIDGVLANSRTHTSPLNTFTDEPINLGCQRNSSNGSRSFFYSGYLNTVRVHGGVLSASQIQSNFILGPAGGPTNAPSAPTGLAATGDTDKVFVEWNAVSGATRYILKRGTSATGPFTSIVTNTTVRTHLDLGLTPGTYYYVVSAGNLFGDSTNSPAVSATTGVPHSLEGLMHRWSFSETNGTTLNDTVGGAHGQVITIEGGGDYALANGQLRLFGGAKGTADYGELPGGLLNGLSNITVEAWVTPWSDQNWARLFDFGSGSGITGSSFFLSLCRGADLDLQRLEFIPFTVDTALPTIPGQAYHYVVTWGATNGAGGGGRMEWYRDGVFAGGMDTGATTLESVDDTVLWLGRSQYPDATADADFDEFRLYDRLLTPAEIQLNRLNGPNTIFVAPPTVGNDAMTLNPGAMALIAVLQNDYGTAINADTLTVVTPPSAGTAQVKPGGKILYTHNGGPATTDQFTYRVANTLGGTSSVATVFLTITNALRLPNTTMTIPNTPPPVGYQTVDAFPNNPFFEDALALRTPRGSSNQLFIAERRGIISYIADVTSPNPVRQVLLDISDQVMFDTGGEGEMGLLGFDFHPGFATNGYVFVAYTALNPRQDRLARFTANPNTLTVDTNTQQILFSVVDEAFNHNGSDVHFGPDGYLYMSMGDEGDQYNFRQNAQRIDKDFYSGLLRIDVDRKPGNVEPNPHSAIATNGSGQAFYKIPIDNPYVHTSLGGAWNGIYFGTTITNLGAVRGEFFATGLRHPWRFWIDPTNSEIWVGDVGQDQYEEVNIVTNGGNYGWAYYEGATLARSLYPGQVNLPTNPPPGLAFAVHTYGHTGQGGDPLLAGNAVIGGVVYRGNRLAELNGAYVFGDFPVGGASTIWSLRRTNSSVVVQRLASDQGIAAFGIDPSNGDVLIAAYGQNKVKRLVRGDVASTFPQKLSDTGVFADLATLSPNPGIVSYDPTIAFWSDHAIKRRWFTIPDLTNTVTFATDTNWTLPAGMKWIKHFDLPLDRNNTNSPRRRLETRILVKTDTGNYGVSYKWNDAQDDAFLVADSGDTFFVTVTNGTPTNQLWEIPSRGSCLACHTTVGGQALTFNTREMNNTARLNGHFGNQIDLLSQAGYFSEPVPSGQMLPVFAKAGDTNASLEFRVRSYLAVNCVQCHQPGGTAPTTWDARPYLTLEQTHLVNTTLVEDGGNPLNKTIVPGDLVHSVLWQRLQGANGFGRMPPLGTHELDQASINLLAAWISGDLTNRQTFAQWQVAHFGSTNSPSAAPGLDFDFDGASNYIEYLTKTDPQLAASVWKLSVSAPVSGQVQLSYPRVPNLGVVIETSYDFTQWTPWDVPGNQPFFGASLDTVNLSGLMSTNPPYQYFRARFVEP
ncbi:MAG TPA: LamG-like jellyroll fold domain-containing protein [Verrucomicrobiae bacterium]|nr:LamG-like jellyroll fold domain-containing protein [Verrucomicrobiae bacterium]